MYITSGSNDYYQYAIDRLSNMIYPPLDGVMSEQGSCFIDWLIHSPRHICIPQVVSRTLHGGSPCLYMAPYYHIHIQQGDEGSQWPCVEHAPLEILMATTHASKVLEGATKPGDGGG